MKTTRYGQKGGDSPTKGRKATTYRVVMPDGTIVKQRSFFADGDPVAYCYQHNSVWYVAAIAERGDSMFSNSVYRMMEVI